MTVSKSAKQIKEAMRLCEADLDAIGHPAFGVDDNSDELSRYVVWAIKRKVSQEQAVAAVQAMFRFHKRMTKAMGPGWEAKIVVRS